MEATSVVTPAVAGLVGLLCGVLWRRHRTGQLHPSSAQQLALLRADLDARLHRIGALEAELAVQHQRCFALERELEASERDCLGTRSGLVSFDANSYEVERPLFGRQRTSAENEAYIADLERHILGLDLQLQRSLSGSDGDPDRACAARRDPASQRRAVSAEWTALDAANSEHGALPAPGDESARPANQITQGSDGAAMAARSSGVVGRTQRSSVDLDGLARHIAAARKHPFLERRVDKQDPADPPPASPWDDLKLIDGIDHSMEQVLNYAGFLKFRDIADATPEQLAWALAAAGAKFACTPHDTWRTQARLLADRRRGAADKFNAESADATRRAAH